MTRVGLSSFLAVDAAHPGAASGDASEANAPPSRSAVEGARSSETVLAAPARGTPLPRTPRAHEVRFVEVKLRDPDDPLADEALTPSKRTRLRACARAWLDAHPHVLGAELAFLVAVVPPEALEPPAREGARDTVWLDDAFDG